MTSQNRREFLKTLGLTAASFSGLATATAATSARRPPNLLFIALDDLNDWVGCLGGHPQVKTPHIDRLAKRGMVFTRAYTAAPICGPSRAAVFSGREPYNTGLYGNRNSMKKLRPDLPIIVMSALNTFMTAVTAAERGAYEYLPKPFDLNELVAVVSHEMRFARRAE